MRKFLKSTIVIVIGLVVLAFALANRQAVVFSLDPLAGTNPSAALVFEMPLFALAIILVTVGVVIGGLTTWFKQGKWRRLARQHESEVRALRAENERLRHETEVRVASVPRISQVPAGQIATIDGP
jgi:hypothetical protein